MADKLSHPVDAGTDVTLGEPDGKVKLVWYVDYTSPDTRQVRELPRRTAERFGAQDVTLAVRQAPSTQPLPDSDIAARAAVAAAAQDRFEAMHGALFEQKGSIDAETVQRLAKALGLDTAQFQADMDADETRKKIAAESESAIASGVFTTPCLVIDGRRYLGAWDETNLIEALEKPTGRRSSWQAWTFVNWGPRPGWC